MESATRQILLVTKNLPIFPPLLVFRAMSRAHDALAALLEILSIAHGFPRAPLHKPESAAQGEHDGAGMPPGSEGLPMNFPGGAPYMGAPSQPNPALESALRNFWASQQHEIEAMTTSPNEFKANNLPLARIKKIMKSGASGMVQETGDRHARQGAFGFVVTAVSHSEVPTGLLHVTTKVSSPPSLPCSSPAISSAPPSGSLRVMPSRSVHMAPGEGEALAERDPKTTDTTRLEPRSLSVADRCYLQTRTCE